jgi:glycosyltransferase involved in cell wall biosynthesis
MTPLISVILAVHNDERYIEESVRSVLEQTCEDFELILVDDGSDDGTVSLVDSLARTDSRIRLFRQRRSGLTCSLIRATAEARGLYLARQDSDDRSRSNRFAVQTNFLNTHPDIAAVGSDTVVIDQSGQRIKAIVGERGTGTIRSSLLSLRSTPIHGSVMMRRESVLAVGGYRLAFTVSQDFDLWLRLTEHCGLDNLSDILYEWRLNPVGVYSTRRIEQMMFSSIALAFTHERQLSGKDSYPLLEAAAGNIEYFLGEFHSSDKVHAQFGELLLRSGVKPELARRHLARGLREGNITARALALFVWSVCRLPWPGIRPMTACKGERSDLYG